MKKIKPLSYSHLYTPCDPKSFNFNNTNDLKELNQIVGQERALDSLQFGIGIEHHGFNLYVQGPSGIGKHAILEQVLRKYVLKKPCQDDWCYVYNFEEPTRPASLRIPHGYAKQFKEDMESFIEDIRNSIPAVFESDEYRLAIQNIEKKIKVEQESQFLKLQKEAHAHKMTILSTPHGFTVAPTEKGKIQTQEELDELTKKQQKQQKQKLDLIKNKLVDLLALVPKWQKITREQKKNHTKRIHKNSSQLFTKRFIKKI